MIDAHVTDALPVIDFFIQYDIALSRRAIAFSGTYPSFDHLMHVFVLSYEPKGLIPVLAFWYLWFRPSSQSPVHRVTLVAVLCTSCIALAVGRLLATSLPFRLRPLASPDIMGADANTSSGFYEWSAMPSDHAIVFFALATGMWLVSRPAGAFLFVHAAFIVCGSRVFTGFHYPGDIVVGAIVGCIISFVTVPMCCRGFARAQSAFPRASQIVTRPELGYPLLAFITFEFATLFDGLRLMGSMLGLFLLGP